MLTIRDSDSEAAASLVASHLAAYDEMLTLKSVVRNARHLTVMSYSFFIFYQHTTVQSFPVSLTSKFCKCVSGWSDKFELSPGPRVWLTSSGSDHS